MLPPTELEGASADRPTSGCRDCLDRNIHLGSKSQARMFITAEGLKTVTPARFSGDGSAAAPTKAECPLSRTRASWCEGEVVCSFGKPAESLLAPMQFMLAEMGQICERSDAPSTFGDGSSQTERRLCCEPV